MCCKRKSLKNSCDKCREERFTQKLKWEYDGLVLSCLMYKQAHPDWNPPIPISLKKYNV